MSDNDYETAAKERTDKMIPKINGSVQVKEEVFRLPNPILVKNDFSDDAVQAFSERAEEKGFQTESAESGFISIVKNAALGEEAYTLSTEKKGVRIEASGEQGVIRALTTLLKKMDQDGSIKAGMIMDAPRMSHRGLHLDVARHFFDAREVKRIIEQMSLAKMNVLHWHLSDDQGWRIESKRFPKLHETSADYYTQEEIRDVVAYARGRGVEIIPEIDMPGHTRGILAAYPQYSCSGKKIGLARAGGVYRRILCAGAEKTYVFLEELLDEICPLFPSGRFHIGGDEAPKAEWKSCPVCTAKMKEQNITSYEDLQGYFSVRVSEILKKYGKRPILWNDSLESRIRPKDMQMQYWTVTYNKPSARYIAQGGQWIYSDMFELYLDYPYAMTSVKKIYENQIDLGSCAYDTENAPLGYEACVWTEQITTDEELEKRIFPRMYVLAELAWCGAGDYEEFEARLQEEMGEAQKRGISVTPYEDWNPEGRKRQEEASRFMTAMHAEPPEEEKEEVIETPETGEDFQRKLMSRFSAL